MPVHRLPRALGSLLALALTLAPRPARAHGNHGGAAAGTAHPGAAIATIRPDESLELSVDLVAYVSTALASGWRSGEPLGAGGKMPLFYNQRLYLEAPFERAGLAKKDYWPQYRDFSYIPLWQPTQVAARVQYAFVPTFRGTVSIAYFGSIDRPTLEPSPLELQELFVAWSPHATPGLTFSMGHLFLVGSYSPGFDQFPLESFQLNGVAVDYHRPFASAETHLRIAAGRSAIGRTTKVELIEPDPAANHTFLDGLRERSHLYGTAALVLAGRLALGVLAGYQLLPADTNNTNDRSPNLVNVWPRSSGWQVGAEAGFVHRMSDHHLTISHGRGDVEMAWGAPDWIYLEDLALHRDRFTRAGSKLSQAVYWGSVRGSRLQLAGGVWGQWRQPARAQREWSVWNDLAQEMETVTATTRDFRALKANLTPGYRTGPVALGLRLDGIRYVDKGATTDTVEPLTDEALRPLEARDPTGTIVDRVEGASRWEREAVDCAVISPFIELTIAQVFRARASWSGALYTRPIYRQHRVSAFHANVALSAWLIHRFGLPRQDR
jgi:hypothetical protein